MAWENVQRFLEGELKKQFRALTPQNA